MTASDHGTHSINGTGSVTSYIVIHPGTPFANIHCSKVRIYSSSY